jgi:hypothetical protein
MFCWKILVALPGGRVQNYKFPVHMLTSKAKMEPTLHSFFCFIYHAPSWFQVLNNPFRSLISITTSFCCIITSEKIRFCFPDFSRERDPISKVIIRNLHNIIYLCKDVIHTWAHVSFVRKSAISQFCIMVRERCIIL